MYYINISKPANWALNKATIFGVSPDCATLNLFLMAIFSQFLIRAIFKQFSFWCSGKRAENFQKQFFHNGIDPFLQSNQNDVCRCWQCWWREVLYHRHQDVCNLYGDVGWLQHYLSGPAQCNIWELNSAFHSKTYIEEIRFLLVGNNMCSATLSSVICGDPSTSGNQVMAIMLIMPLCWWSSTVRQKLEL